MHVAKYQFNCSRDIPFVCYVHMYGAVEKDSKHMVNNPHIGIYRSSGIFALLGLATTPPTASRNVSEF
jgi:hypothetical protein